jgi:hypothetical protein
MSVATTKPQSKPARLQVDPDTIPDDDKPPQTGTVFNIWFLKWSGGESSNRSYVNLKFRVNIAKDAGYTKATKGPLCLFFARGCCYRGKKCQYLHRLPLDTDYILPTQDCFGRDKTSEYNDDMDGVGSFNRTNRTLYVGGLHMNKDIENILTKHFLEFGDIEKIRVLHSKSCAFLTYRLESQAQFCKEAMQNQSLDGNEVLYIRWASEDPNPNAQKEEKRRLESIAIDTVKNLLEKVDQEDSDRKRQKTFTVQEPTEDSLEEETQHKLIAQLKPTKLSFNQTSLSILSTLRKKQVEHQKASKPENISSLIGDYESSDEE